MAILGFSFRISKAQILTKSRLKIKVNRLDNYKWCIYHNKKLSICIKIFKVALFVAKIESKLGYFEGTILNLHMDNLIIDSISATVLWPHLTKPYPSPSPSGLQYLRLYLKISTDDSVLRACFQATKPSTPTIIQYIKTRIFPVVMASLP